MIFLRIYNILIAYPQSQFCRVYMQIGPHQLFLLLFSGAQQHGANRVCITVIVRVQYSTINIYGKYVYFKTLFRIFYRILFATFDFFNSTETKKKCHPFPIEFRGVFFQEFFEIATNNLDPNWKNAVVEKTDGRRHLTHLDDLILLQRRRLALLMILWRLLEELLLYFSMLPKGVMTSVPG